MASPPTTPVERTDSLQRGIGAALGVAPSLSEDNISGSMRISLLLEARGLPNMDTRGKSDPFVIIYRKIDSRNSNASASDEWLKIGQTETVYNNLNPKWSTTFSVEYRFGTHTILRFRVYDRDSKDDDLSKQDYIGEVTCTVAQVVLADNQRLIHQIKNPASRPGAQTGSLIIRGEEQKGDLGDSVTFQFAVTNLRRGKKPFYVLSRKNRNDNDFSPVVYSEVHQNYAGSSHVTTFKPITKPLARLVNGDLDRELRIEFMDYDRRGSHYRGGGVRFTLREARANMIRAATPSNTPARYLLRKKKTNGQVVNAGVLIMKKCDISVPYSFLDYIRSGLIMNTVIAVDMSVTNGHPSDPQSLHYNNQSTPNEYVIALRAVGSVLAAYDTSNTFPAYGFGAGLPGQYNVASHCFSLTGDITSPVCYGIEGVVNAYYDALGRVAPFAPCKYGPMLEHVIRIAKEENSRDARTVYTVLLLITDGDFTDFAETANLICSAAELPLSIVIVGVGNTRFLRLEKLDGDVEPLCSSEGTPCARDIVQFVQFHKHRYNPTQLAREVLDEIPEQLLSYMRSKSIKPSDITPGNFRHQESAGPGPYIPTAALNQMNSQSLGQSVAMMSTMSTAPPPGITHTQQSVPQSPQLQYPYHNGPQQPANPHLAIPHIPPSPFQAPLPSLPHHPPPNQTQPHDLAASYAHQNSDRYQNPG